jgi:hypothetical protein
VGGPSPAPACRQRRGAARRWCSRRHDLLARRVCLAIQRHADIPRRVRTCAAQLSVADSLHGSCASMFTFIAAGSARALSCRYSDVRKEVIGVAFANLPITLACRGRRAE